MKFTSKDKKILIFLLVAAILYWCVLNTSKMHSIRMVVNLIRMEDEKKAFEERIEKVDHYLSSINVEGEYFVKGSNVDTEMVADYTGL